MKRIGILTYHNVINYGAFLQAYSLEDNLKKSFPDCDIEIIDFAPFSKMKRYFFKIPVWILMKKGVKSFIHCMKKYRIFFLSQNNLVKSDRHIFTDDYGKLYAYLNKNYDYIIVGSDAVFNDSDINGFSPYYLEGVKCHKISYAASCHGLNYLNMNETKRIRLAASFNEFDIIGVRDRWTQNYINYCNANLKVNYCCDPALLFNLKSIKSNYRINNEGKKIIIVMLKHEYICKSIRDMYGYEYKIVSLVRENKYADEYIWNITPFDWALIFSQADLIFSEFFHGIIFALKNNKPVIAIDPSESKEWQNTKIGDLLYNRLHLQEFYFHHSIFDSKENCPRLFDQCKKNMTIDYSEKINSAVEAQKTTFDSFCAELRKNITNSDCED